MSSIALILHLVRQMTGRRLKTRLDVVFGVVGEVVGIVLTVAGPYVLKLLVDALSKGAVTPGTLILYVLLFVLAWSGTSMTTAVKLVHTTRIVDALARHLTASALRSQLPVIARERSGDSGRILGLLERLPYSLQVVVDGLLWRAAPLLIQVGVCLVVIGTLVPLRYVVIMGGVLGAYLLAAHRGAGRYQQRARETNLASASLSQAVGDVLRNARRVVFNGNMDGELDAVAGRAKAKLDAAEALSWSLVRMSALQYGAVGAGLTLLLVLSGLDVGAGRLTVGDFVLLQAYAFRLALPLSGFGFVLSQSGVSLANIGDVLDLIHPEHEATAPGLARAGAAAITLDGVGFRYGPGLAGVSDLNASIAPASFVAIVGPNGSGKSTLAQLIAGLLEPTEGMVRIDDRDLIAIPRADRHRQVLYVPQFIGLFNRSLRANALYPPTRQTETTLAALLGDWRFYEDGRAVDLDLVVGEQGERLSGGQIQKLELARLVGVQVPAIILDESTSSLDMRSEQRVIEALRDSFGGHTTLILITHRLRLAEQADQILYLRGGRLIATGRHSNLARSHLGYRELWAMDAGDVG